MHHRGPLHRWFDSVTTERQLYRLAARVTKRPDPPALDGGGGATPHAGRMARPKHLILAAVCIGLMSMGAAPAVLGARAEAPQRLAPRRPSLAGAAW